MTTQTAASIEALYPLGHPFVGVAGHPDDDECTNRADGTDATYCSESEADHTPIWSDDPQHPNYVPHPDNVCECGTLGAIFDGWLWYCGPCADTVANLVIPAPVNTND